MAGIASALIAGGLGLAGTVASRLIPGAATGSGGSAANQNSTTTTDYNTNSASHGTVGTSYDPQFQAATSKLIDQAGATAARPYWDNGGNKVAGVNGTQEDAFWGVKNNPNLSNPYFDASRGYFSQAGQYNAATAAQPFLNQGQTFLDRAAGAQTGSQAAQPYADMATGSFTGNNVSRYMDPYFESALRANNNVANSNLTSNLLPAMNSQFIGSGGGARAGNNAYSSYLSNNVLTPWANSLNNSNALMTNAAYATAGQNFQSDQNRYAGLAGTMGGLANSTLGQYGSLASSAFGGAGTAANAASAANRDFTSLGTANQNAGRNVSDVGLNNSAALLGVGNSLQALQQRGLDVGQANWQKSFDYPQQQNAELAKILQTVRVPTTVTSDNAAETQGHQTSNTIGQTGSTSSSTPSLIGTALGLGTGAASILKGVDWSKVFGNGGNAGPAIEGDQGGKARGGPVGYFGGGPVRFGGLDERYSSPPFATNAGYWGTPPLRPIYGRNGTPEAYYARGGNVRGHFAAGGQTNPDADLMMILRQALQQPNAFGRLEPTMPPMPTEPMPFFGGSANGDSGSVGVGSPGDSGGISGTGETYRRGGHFKFAAGGAAPVIKAAKAANDKYVAGARAKAKKPAAGITRQLELPGSGAGFFR